MSEGEFFNPIRNKIKSTFLRRKPNPNQSPAPPPPLQTTNLLSRRAVALKNHPKKPQSLSHSPSLVDFSNNKPIVGDHQPSAQSTAFQTLKKQFYELQSKYIRLLLSQLSHISDANLSIASSRGKSTSRAQEELLHLKERLLKLDFSHFLASPTGPI